jgi:hypothetical protein
MAGYGALLLKKPGTEGLADQMRCMFSLSPTMFPSSFTDLQGVFSVPRDIVYVTVGTVVVSLGLHYARKVNRVADGEPPLLPGALPILGHALTFLKDSNKVYETAR